MCFLRLPIIPLFLLVYACGATHEPESETLATKGTTQICGNEEIPKGYIVTRLTYSIFCRSTSGTAANAFDIKKATDKTETMCAGYTDIPAGYVRVREDATYGGCDAHFFRKG